MYSRQSSRLKKKKKKKRTQRDINFRPVCSLPTVWISPFLCLNLGEKKMISDEICGPSSRALLRAVRKDLCCPICLDVYSDPVALPCAHIFCRSCFQRALQRHLVCPLCKNSVTARSVTPLPTLAALISLAQAVALRAGVADITDSQVAFPSAPPTPVVAPLLACGMPRLVDDVKPTLSVGGDAPTILLTERSDLTPWRLSGNIGKKRSRTIVVDCSGSTSSSRSSQSSPSSSSLSSTSGSSSFSLSSTSMSSSEPVNDVPASGAEATSSEPSLLVSASVRSNRCILCGLDIHDRDVMRSFLHFIAAHDPTCNVQRLRHQSEESLSALLGSMCGPFYSAKSITSASPSTSALRPVWAHYSCLVWSPEVRLESGRLVHIEDAIRRGKQIRCAACGKLGATIGCRVGVCRKSFHFPCAAFCGQGVCEINDGSQDDLSLVCAKHRQNHSSGCGHGTQGGSRTQSMPSGGSGTMPAR